MMADTTNVPPRNESMGQPGQSGACGPERSDAPSSRPTLSVTVVIPAFNEDKNIARLTQQILDEPWDDGLVLEAIVIVDDCSDDGTQAISEDLAREHERVWVIRHPQRRGKNAGMRTGYAACRSAIVAFVDADVLLGPRCLTRMIGMLAHDSSLTAVSCVVAPLPARSWRERAPQFQALVIAQLSRHGHGSLARVYAVRAAAIASMRLPDDTADDLFTLRWLRNNGYRFAVCAAAVAYVRTTSGLRDFAKQTLRIWLSGEALEKMLPPASGVMPFAPRRRGTVTRALAHAIRREPLGFVLYLIWRGIIKVTPTRVWLPSFDHSRYDTSQSTKDLGL